MEMHVHNLPLTGIYKGIFVQVLCVEENSFYVDSHMFI